MTDKAELLALALRCEQATGPDRALNREIAIATGWHRYSPSEIGKKNPGWIAPEDFIGEYEGKDGRKTPKLDSLHGTEVWREPRAYLWSLDAAMSLVPEAWFVGAISQPDPVRGETLNYAALAQTEMREIDRGFGQPPDEDRDVVEGHAATSALALTAAALRALASESSQ